jgi:SAM-dependent methyltransferase
MDHAHLSHATEQALECRVCGTRAAPDGSYEALGLYRCPSCGFLFAPAPQSAPGELYGDDYFEQYPGGERYTEDEAQRRYEARIRVGLLERFLSAGRVLEIGAAAGHFLDEARNAGFAGTGIEPAPGVAERARERLGVDVRAGLVEDADFPAGSFDAICGWHVLEHLAEPRAALEHIRPWLQPGGYILLEVPNVDSVHARRRGAHWFHLDPDHHVGHYGPRSLEMLLERAGFDVIGTETFPALGYVRPARALRPGNLAMQAKELIDVRARPRRPHASKHELLRAFGQRK